MSFPKFVAAIFFLTFAVFAIAAPNGYIEVGSSDSLETTWFMHPDVSTRPMKNNPKDVNVLADIWTEERGRDRTGYKQAFNCKEGGVSF